MNESYKNFTDFIRNKFPQTYENNTYSVNTKNSVQDLIEQVSSEFDSQIEKILVGISKS